jgi:hypothetical protein
MLLAAAIGACAPEPQPRTVLDFMEDGLAREGVLTRCNHDRDATLQDVECSNARRAAAALAIEAERARAGDLEHASERKLAAVRELEAREAAAARGSTSGDNASAGVASFGAPIGSVLPSIGESTVYADQEPLGRPSLDIDAQPPANDIAIVEPEIELAKVAVIPRPFRTDDANAPR